MNHADNESLVHSQLPQNGRRQLAIQFGPKIKRDKRREEEQVPF